MYELSIELVEYLLAKTEFTSVMDNRLTPFVSSEDEVYPFANYVVKEDPGFSKDEDALSGALLFYFEKGSYLKLVQFLDVMKPIIKEKYDWLGSDIEFVEDDQSFVGIINFNKI
jgi:hypothetical protein